VNELNAMPLVVAQIPEIAADHDVGHDAAGERRGDAQRRLLVAPASGGLRGSG